MLATLPPPPSTPTPLPTSALAHPTSNLTQVDKSRFQTWLSRDLRLPELAESCDTNVVDLALWAAQPHITALLDHIRHIAAQRSQTLYAEAKHAAISRLLTIIRDDANNETARRAADRLLRPNIAQVLEQDFEPFTPNTSPRPRDNNPHDGAYHLVATKSKLVLSTPPAPQPNHLPQTAPPTQIELPPIPDACVTWTGPHLPTAAAPAPTSRIRTCEPLPEGGAGVGFAQRPSIRGRTQSHEPPERLPVVCSIRPTTEARSPASALIDSAGAPSVVTRPSSPAQAQAPNHPDHARADLTDAHDDPDEDLDLDLGQAPACSPLHLLTCSPAHPPRPP